VGALDRVLLFVYTVALMAFSAVSLVVSLGYREPFRLFELAFATASGRWATGAVSLLVLVAAARVMYSAFSHPRAQVVHSTELGEVRISREAVEHLVQRVARQVRGVRDVRPRVTIADEGIAARLRISVSPDVGIRGLAGQIQDELRRAVREVVGVELTELEVAVDNITAEARRTRLE
jgi:uncharacterized alkaline shock family protein YloU